MSLGGNRVQELHSNSSWIGTLGSGSTLSHGSSLSFLRLVVDSLSDSYSDSEEVSESLYGSI
jgi:hypothetical protein